MFEQGGSVLSVGGGLFGVVRWGGGRPSAGRLRLANFRMTKSNGGEAGKKVPPPRTACSRRRANMLHAFDRLLVHR